MGAGEKISLFQLECFSAGNIKDKDVWILLQLHAEEVQHSWSIEIMLYGYRLFQPDKSNSWVPKVILISDEELSKEEEDFSFESLIHQTTN